MIRSGEGASSLRVVVIADGRSAVLAEPVRRHLSSLGHPTEVLHLPAAGEPDTRDMCPEVEETFRSGAVGVLISSSGSGLGMVLNKCAGIRVTTCFNEQMAAEAARLPDINGCEVFSGHQLDELLKIAVAFLENLQVAR